MDNPEKHAPFEDRHDRTSVQKTKKPSATRTLPKKTHSGQYNWKKITRETGFLIELHFSFLNLLVMTRKLYVTVYYDIL